MCARNFDEQNFDELIVGFIGKALAGKRLEGKTFVLYGIYNLNLVR